MSNPFSKSEPGAAPAAPVVPAPPAAPSAPETAPAPPAATQAPPPAETAPAGPPVALVRMTRSAEIAKGGPLTADVHPDEVVNYSRHGWSE